MPAQESIAAALGDIERARRMLTRLRGKQLRNREERQYMNALALSWFRGYRPEVIAEQPQVNLDQIDVSYRTVLDASAKSTSSKIYSTALSEAKASLIELRGSLLTGVVTRASSSDTAPDFSRLASDAAMQAILRNRWEECSRCVSASAYLAATVMMGGMLEALLVARANQMPDKSPLFKAKSAPLDSRTKKPLDLRQWTLAPYIDVAHELGWISRSAKDVAIVLRDYRNYVHPEKERAHGVVLGAEDAKMFWEVVKTCTRQLLASTIVSGR